MAGGDQRTRAVKAGWIAKLIVSCIRSSYHMNKAESHRAWLRGRMGAHSPHVLRQIRVLAIWGIHRTRSVFKRKRLEMISDDKLIADTLGTKH